MRYLPKNHSTINMRVLLFSFLMIYASPLMAKGPLLTAKEISTPPSNVIRTCCAFGVDLSVARIPFVKKTDIIAARDMGFHHYLGSKDEGNGIIYTKRGGFIDLGHLRDYADWTAYLYKLIQSNRESGKHVVLNLDSEGGPKTLVLNNLKGLDSLQIPELAGKMAYDLSVWHEIATWFGASYIPMIPERYSSFSPEDLYSNLLGVKLGIMAINSDLEYNEAMTNLLASTLDSLEVVTTVEETYDAMEQVENIWWTRKKALPSSKVLLARYLDSESFLMPWLLPDEENQISSYKLDKPDPGLSDFYELSIALNRKFLMSTMASTQLNKIITQNDFRWIIDMVEDDQKNLYIKSAIRIQKVNMRKERKQHAIYLNQA